MKTMILTSAALLGLGTAAFAADELRSVYDTDEDGYVTFAELQNAHPDVSMESFYEADTDADGLLNAREIAEGKTEGLLPKGDEKG
ncbi:hypothetical protein [Sagittula sp. SSi028]|uniref:hypothetical protein n=1 Tax=Sagittula sp. SSi028 TaxID=3400636 RepID=UPI003AF85B0C